MHTTMDAVFFVIRPENFKAKKRKKRDGNFYLFNRTA